SEANQDEIEDGLNETVQNAQAHVEPCQRRVESATRIEKRQGERHGVEEGRLLHQIIEVVGFPSHLRGQLRVKLLVGTPRIVDDSELSQRRYPRRVEPRQHHKRPKDERDHGRKNWAAQAFLLANGGVRPQLANPSDIPHLPGAPTWLATESRADAPLPT